MRRPPTLASPAHQRGLALLILLGIIGLGVIFALVTGLTRTTSALAQDRAQKTTNALAQAKAALIAYAVTYKDTHDNSGTSTYYVPGYLPCPDQGSGTEGVAAGSCGASLVSVMGKLPWYSLGLDALKDGSGECLWYAVSGTYKNNPNGVSGSTSTSNMMNWDTNGQLKVMDTDGSTILAGSTADTKAVAVIFAPGAVLSGQDRTPAAGTTNCRGNYTAAAYLETANSINNSTLVTPSSPANVADTSTFIAGTESTTFNDKLVYITRADIWNAIKKRADFNNYLRAMTRLAAECTAMYGNQNSIGSDHRLPWASSVSLSGTSVPTYAVNARYNDASSAEAGRLSFRVDTSRTTTTNALSNSISDYGTNNAYLYTNSSYCSYTADQKVWYDNWKDQLFVALGWNFRPGTSWWLSGGCPTCLTINGSGNYAAVVIFAGDKLTDAAGLVTQPRSLATDKGSIANYLEGRNSSNYPNNSGNGNYQAAAVSSTFNDIIYAIDSNLNVKCSTTAGAMASMTTLPTSSPPSNWTSENLASYAACP